MGWLWDLLTGRGPAHLQPQTHRSFAPPPVPVSPTLGTVHGGGGNSTQAALVQQQALLLAQHNWQNQSVLAGHIVQIPSQPAPVPDTIVARDHFSRFVRMVEDIDNPKRPYDAAVMAMLDMRPLREKSEVDLVALCQFMIDNGVDPKNIAPLVRAVESWGFTFK